MSDPLPPGDPEWLGVSAPDSQTQEATKLLVRADVGASMLRLAALLAGLLWVVTAVSAFATEWHQIDGSGGGFSAAGSDGTSTVWHLTTSVTLSGQASWGYALAAAVLFAASVWLSRERARDALDALDDD
jgi:hypothetical protein